MPQIATAEEIAFLDELDAWIAQGRPAYRFAAEKGIAPSTLTYRKRQFGLDDKRAVGLVDRRSGDSYRELRARGDIIPEPEPDPELAGAPA